MWTCLSPKFLILFALAGTGTLLSALQGEKTPVPGPVPGSLSGSVPGRAPGPSPLHGFAWKVQGTWKDLRAGKEIAPGAVVLPDSLVEPLGDSGAHSLTILLPDGQRVLSECFTAEDCRRGFRVPLLTQAPSPFDEEMLERMRSLVEQRQKSAKREHGPQGRTTPAQQDEVIATLSPKTGADQAGPRQIKVQGLLGSMPSGSYTYEQRVLDAPSLEGSPLRLQKTSSGCVFSVAGPGLYQITVFDKLNTRRLNLLVAAVEPGQTSISADFGHARKVLSGWNAKYYGWPVHDLLRAYLESFPQLQPRS